MNTSLIIDGAHAPHGGQPSPLPIIGRMPGAAVPTGIALAFAAQDGVARDGVARDGVARDGAAQDGSAAERFDLLLVDAAGRTLSRLGPFGEEEVVAVWRDIAARAGLARLILREDGGLAPLGEQLGRISLGRVRIRRRHASLGARRPRFLVRRKTARLPARPQIHRGETEMTARH